MIDDDDGGGGGLIGFLDDFEDEDDDTSLRFKYSSLIIKCKSLSAFAKSRNTLEGSSSLIMKKGDSCATLPVLPVPARAALVDFPPSRCAFAFASNTPKSSYC